LLNGSPRPTRIATRPASIPPPAGAPPQPPRRASARNARLAFAGFGEGDRLRGRLGSYFSNGGILLRRIMSSCRETVYFTLD
jgi:hypothetical protein